MVKFIIEEKLEAVKCYENGTESQRVIANSISVDNALFRTWIQ